MDKFAINYNNSRFLKTSKTAAHPNRLNWRCEILLTRNQDIIKGKRILDLASHDGRFSYACLKLGARHVTGVEGRDYLTKFAKKNIKEEGFSDDRFCFVQGDAIGYLSRAKTGQFDIILCFGFFYHTIEQVRLLKEITRISPDYLILDTYLANFCYGTSNRLKKWVFSLISRKYPALIFQTESHEREGSTTGSTNIVSIPTEAFLEFYFRENNYKFKKLSWNKTEIKNWANIEDYRNDQRVSYLVTFEK